MIHVKQEINFRNLKNSNNYITPDFVLKDTIDTCLIITKREANKEESDKMKFKLLQEGIKSFGTGYLMSGKFRLEEAMSASSKIALLASKLLVGDLSPISYYKGENINKMTIENSEWNFLNKLKKQPDKSMFFYWYQTVELLIKQ